MRGGPQAGGLCGWYFLCVVCEVGLAVCVPGRGGEAQGGHPSQHWLQACYRPPCLLRGTYSAVLCLSALNRASWEGSPDKTQGFCNPLPQRGEVVPTGSAERQLFPKGPSSEPVSSQPATRQCSSCFLREGEEARAGAVQ